MIFGKKIQKSVDLLLFFGLFSIYLAPSGAKYREKGWAVTKIGEGVIDKPILELLTFGSNPDFSDLDINRAILVIS